MKVRHFGDNLWQLTQFGVFNCYLVRDGGSLTLIDAGLSNSANGIQQAAAAIGLPITRITLTHGHGDHVGSLDTLAARLPDAEIIFGTRTADFLAGDQSLHPGEATEQLRGSYVRAKTTAARLVNDGDHIGALRVVAAPGHTPDHLAFYDDRDGTLIAGDAFQTQGGIAVAGVRRWAFPLPAMATWSLATATASAQQLLALAPARLAVGHGRVLEQPVAAMTAAIATASATASATVERARNG